MLLAASLPLKVFLAYSVWENIKMEHATDRVFELGNARASLHCLIYLLRLLMRLVLQRALRLLSANRVTHKWKLADEILVRVVHFHFKIASTRATNNMMKVNAAINRLSLVPTGKLSVDSISGSKLGFHTAAAQQRFGDLECTAIWATLDKQIKLETNNVKVLYYVHGGGFCFGSADMYLPAFHHLLQVLKTQFGIANVGILSIEYPLAPTVKHPMSMEMCYFALEHLVATKQYFQSDNVIVAGDSAGGSIALNLAIRGKQELGIRAACLFSPWVAQSTTTMESYREFAELDIIGGNAIVQRFQNTHVQGGQPMSTADQALHVIDRKLNFGKLLPQVWVNCGEFEIFRDDIVRLVREIQASEEGKVEFIMGEACPHDYAMLWPLCETQSEAALVSCAKFCAAIWK